MHSSICDTDYRGANEREKGGAMSICEMVKMLKWYYPHSSQYEIPYQYEIAYFSVQDPVIYAQKQGGRSAKFGIMVCKASMLD